MFNLASIPVSIEGVLEVFQPIAHHREPEGRQASVVIFHDVLDLLKAFVVFIEQLLVVGIIKILGNQVHVVETKVFGLHREEFELLRVSGDNVAEVETIFDARAAEKRRREQANEERDNHDLGLRLFQHFTAVPSSEPSQREFAIAILEIQLVF